MLTPWRTLVLVVACSLLLGASTSVRSHAEESATAPKDAVQSAPADQPADAASMPGCPAADGTCCGACQEKMKQPQPAADAQGGCPCQRARKAAQTRS